MHTLLVLLQGVPSLLLERLLGLLEKYIEDVVIRIIGRQYQNCYYYYYWENMLDIRY